MKETKLIKRDSTEQPLYPVSNVFLAYNGYINVGTNNTEYLVLFDTGSCQLWIDHYDGSNSTKFTLTNTVAPRLNYMDGTIVDGVFVSDTVRIGNITLETLQFENAVSISPGFSPSLRGVVGLCHNFVGSKSPLNFVDEAYNAGKLTEKMFAFAIAADTRTASLTLGGYDRVKYENRLAWIPVSQTSNYWEAPLTNIITSTGEINWSGKIRAVFDTGSSMLVLPPSLAKSVNEVLGFTKMQGSAVYTGPCPGNLAEFIKITVSSVLMNIKTRTLVYGNGKVCYSSIMDGNNGDLAVIGNSVLRNYYTVFNGMNHTVGIATLNGSLTVKQDDPNKDDTTTSASSPATIASIIIVLLLLVATSIGFYIYKRRRNQKQWDDENVDQSEDSADIDDSSSREIRGKIYGNSTEQNYGSHEENPFDDNNSFEGSLTVPVATRQYNGYGYDSYNEENNQQPVSMSPADNLYFPQSKNYNQVIPTIVVSDVSNNTHSTYHVEEDYLDQRREEEESHSDGDSHWK